MQTRWIVTLSYSYADDMYNCRVPREIHADQMPEGWVRGAYGEQHRIFHSRDEANRFYETYNRSDITRRRAEAASFYREHMHTRAVGYARVS
jgi:hypothetical protein